jgi:putative addiction module killer protein
MFDVRQTEVFADWLKSLSDRSAKARIEMRLRRAELGNLGDVKFVGGGVSEMRIDYGPGYRVYFVKRGTAIIVLLQGGDKASQSRDIERAKAMAKNIGEIV